MAQSWPPRLWGAQNELHTRAVSALALLVTVLVSLVVEVSGTVALPMEQIANVRFMILILYGRTHKRHTIDAVVVLGTTADENLRGYATTTTPSTCTYCKYYSSTEILE